MIGPRYDAIVIGAGSAGAVVAARLSEDPRRSVLLLEAGPDYVGLAALPPKLRDGYLTSADMVRSDHDWGYVGVATPMAGPLGIMRGKVTGGSSAINGQIFLRGTPADYDGWAALGNDRWSWQHMLPCFCRLERDLDFAGPHHGASGPIPVRRFRRDEWLPPQAAFVAACRAEGFAERADLNEPGVEGVGPVPLNNVDGIRWSTSTGYLDPARDRLNLTIRARCHARRLVFDGSRVVGVEIASGAGLATAYADQVICSAGPIGSPHLLMLSGIGPADQLATAGVPIAVDLPGVGRNLRDHPHVGALWRPKPGYPMLPELPRYQVALRYTVPGSHLPVDMQILMISYATGRVDRGGDGHTPLGIALQPVLNLAVGQGEIRLRSTEPTVQPLIDMNLLAEPFDRSRLRDALRLCVKLARHAAFADILGPRVAPDDGTLGSDEALDAWMMREVTHTHHLSGTCKMGPAADSLAVVDQRGRVYGVTNLRVADCSIMPDCVRANTNATAMAIGERMAELIAEES